MSVFGSTEVKIDLDVLDNVKTVYDTEIIKLTEAVDALDTAIEELRSSAWKTNGSDEFFNNYDEMWSNQFREHIAYLEHLRDCLSSAQTGFHEQYDNKM